MQSAEFLASQTPSRLSNRVKSVLQGGISFNISQQETVILSEITISKANMEKLDCCSQLLYRTINITHF